MKLSHFLTFVLTFLSQNAVAQQCKNLKEVDSNCKDLDQNGTTGGHPWYDSSGPDSKFGPPPDCEWYGQYWARCEKDGNSDQNRNFGMTACQVR